MLRKLIFIVFLFQIIYSEYYKDRIRIYVENSVKNFEINSTNSKSNNDELNSLMDLNGATRIERWLPNDSYHSSNVKKTYTELEWE